MATAVIVHVDDQSSLKGYKDYSEDDQLIDQAEDLSKELKTLAAARALSAVKDKNKLKSNHHDIIKVAEDVMKVIPHHLEPAQDDWTKQGEMHGNRNTVIYYMIDNQGLLECRIETPIESSLLVPLISVMNEVQLFNTWVPSYNFPVKMGLEETLVLKDNGIGSKKVLVRCNFPTPMKNRELIQESKTVDDIDDTGSIIIMCNTLDEDIPGKNPKSIQMNSDWCMVVRKCPANHHCLKKSKKKKYPENEDILLISFTGSADAKVDFVPQSIINFFTRVTIGEAWGTMLKVAEGVRDGKRPLHKEAIESNRELYGFIDRRYKALVTKLNEN